MSYVSSMHVHVPVPSMWCVQARERVEAGGGGEVRGGRARARAK